MLITKLSFGIFLLHACVLQLTTSNVLGQLAPHKNVCDCEIIRLCLCHALSRNSTSSAYPDTSCDNNQTTTTNSLTKTEVQQPHFIYISKQLSFTIYSGSLKRQTIHKQLLSKLNYTNINYWLGDKTATVLNHVFPERVTTAQRDLQWTSTYTYKTEPVQECI